jgi:predicted ATPase/class 3 adenylate cyclase
MALQLPTGTVAFLFTDVEDSTGLARRIGAGYTHLVGEHFGLIQQIVEERGGVEVKTMGDGVFAVFSDTTTALDAASAIQRAMNRHRWPAGGEVKVRVGVHTGEADVVAADYVGIEVSRAARVMAAGHGGQVLVSDPARLDARDGFDLKSLGRHLLRGLETEEVIYQLVVPGLPAEFPPLRTPSAAPNNLPTRVSSLIGREADVEALSLLIDDHPLVTVLGPGGVGKTSLAIAVGSRVIQGFPGGVVFTDLSSITDPKFVMSSIATGLGAEPRTVEGIAAHLGQERSLLILDNFEQVVAAAPDVGRLVSSTTDTTVLVTSQAPLRLSGEHRYALGPLGGGAENGSAGVRLFIERARAVDPGFDGDTETVAELVGYLDGLPLAIELVAARANLLGPAEMLERLRSGRMSYAASADSPERHRTLDHALRWSHELLSDPTQRVLRRLGVFAGSMSLDAAEEVAGEDQGVDPLAEIAELVDRSLLVRTVPTVSRVKMLDSIRRFARRLLDESPESETVTARYVAFYTDLCRRAYDGLQGDRGEWWRAQLDDDLENLRDVLSILQRDGNAADGLELLGNTWRFYQSRGHLGELEIWLDRFVRLPGAEDDALGPIKGLMARAAVYYWQKKADEAVNGYRESVDRARRLDDRHLLAEALFGLATSLIISQKTEEAMPALEECEAIFRELDDRSGLADVLAGEAFAALSARGLAGLGPKFEEASHLYESVGRRIQATQALYAQAGVALFEGRLDEAHRLAVTGIRRGVELNDVFLQVWGIEYVSRITLDAGDVERAALLAGAAAAAQMRIGGGWSPESVGLEDTSQRLMQDLGEERAAEMLEPGRDLDISQAVVLALGESEA